MSSKIVKRAGPMRWWIEIDPVLGEGLGTECGPFWTRTFARIHRRIWLQGQ